jgi:hypothetical protein
MTALDAVHQASRALAALVATVPELVFEIEELSPPVELLGLKSSKNSTSMIQKPASHILYFYLDFSSSIKHNNLQLKSSPKTSSSQTQYATTSKTLRYPAPQSN